MEGLKTFIVWDRSIIVLDTKIILADKLTYWKKRFLNISLNKFSRGENQIFFQLFYLTSMLSYESRNKKRMLQEWFLQLFNLKGNWRSISSRFTWIDYLEYLPD